MLHKTRPRHQSENGFRYGLRRKTWVQKTKEKAPMCLVGYSSDWRGLLQWREESGSVKRIDQAAMDPHPHSLNRHYAISFMTNTRERTIPNNDAGVSLFHFFEFRTDRHNLVPTQCSYCGRPVRNREPTKCVPRCKSWLIESLVRGACVITEWPNRILR